MNIPAWLLIPDTVPAPTQNDVRAHALAILASGGQGGDLKGVLGNALGVLFQQIPAEIAQFGFEGGSFDRGEAVQASRLSLHADIEPLILDDWKRVLSPKLRAPEQDWPYGPAALAAWRVAMSVMEMLQLRALDVRLSNQPVGCRLQRD